LGGRGNKNGMDGVVQLGNLGAEGVRGQEVAGEAESGVGQRVGDKARHHYRLGCLMASPDKEGPL